MKRFQKISIALLFTCLMPLLSWSQKEISKGSIVMEITEVKAGGQGAEMLEMMKGSQTEIYFTESKSLVKANMMGGMILMTTLLDNTTEDQVMLFDAMGQKMMIESSKEEREEMSGDQVDVLKELEVIFDEKDTKDILGYKCTKATIKHPAMTSGLSFEAYIARDIKASSKLIQGMNYLELDGFPLEYMMDAGQVQLTFSTIEFNEEVDMDIFDLNTGGYKKMTFKEFMDSMGQMGGGFGY